MLKKAITYDNIDEQEVTEDFYFSFTKAELIENMLVDPNGDLEVSLRKVMASNDRRLIMDTFKKYISESVGYRTPDGKFVKTPEYAQQFMSSEAYSALFDEFLTDTTKITEFINGLMPRKLREQVAAAHQGDATVVELPNSGVIEGVAGDAAVQAEKPQPTFRIPEQISDENRFPQATEAAIVQNQVQQNEDPAWLKEGRQPTRQEMMKMTKEELQFVFKMKEAGLLS